MYSYAMSSSSSVVTPGFTCSRSSASVWPTMPPALRISSISSVVFRFIAISLYPNPALRRHFVCDYGPVQSTQAVVQHVSGDLFDWLVAVDFAQYVLVAIVLNYRHGLLEVDLQPLDSSFALVVVALEQLATVQVANPRNVGWGELLVIDVPALGAGPSPGKAVEQHLIGGLHVNRLVDYLVSHAESLVQSRGLRSCPGEAVEQHTVLYIGLGDALYDHLDHELIRHQLALDHIFLGDPAELGSPLAVVPQEVAARYMHELQLFVEELGLGAFACARGS